MPWLLVLFGLFALAWQMRWKRMLAVIFNWIASCSEKRLGTVLLGGSNACLV